MEGTHGGDGASKQITEQQTHRKREEQWRGYMASSEERVASDCGVSDRLLVTGGTFGDKVGKLRGDREEPRLHFSPAVSFQRYCCRKCSSIISQCSPDSGQRILCRSLGQTWKVKTGRPIYTLMSTTRLYHRPYKKMDNTFLPLYKSDAKISATILIW